MWYNVGTVSLVQGSVTVTGVGTDFVSNTRAADMFVGPDGVIYEVVNYTNETTLAIKPAYKGPSISNTPDYFVIPINGYTKLAADRLHKITLGIDDIQADVESSAQNAALALSSKNAAAASQSAAAASAAAALASKNAAGTSETNAAASAAAALASKNAAGTSETNALASKNAAATSATNAAASESNALASKNAAAISATSAGTSATNAGISETNALASKNAAAASQTAAGTSATNAAADRAQVAADKGVVTTARDVTLAARDVATAARDEAVNAAATVTGSLIDKGYIDLSGGAYPAKPAFSAFWKVTVGGTVSGEQYGMGDTLVYTKPQDAFYKIDNTESVSSVAGFTGAISKEQLGIVKTASREDTTSDSILKVGDFGENGGGAIVKNSSFNANTITVPGTYVFNGGGINIPESTVYLKHIGHAVANWAKQLAWSFSTNKSYSRTQNNGTWTAWTPITEIVNDLVTTATDKALSAAQGKALYDLLLANNATVIRYTYNLAAGAAVIGGADSAGKTLSYVPGSVMLVDKDGFNLRAADDYTATNGTSINLITSVEQACQLNITVFGSFTVADHYTKAESEALYYSKLLANGTFLPFTSARGFIDGFRIIYNGRQSITVTAGSAYISSLGRVVTLSADKLMSGLTSLPASAFSHIYLFENAGVGDIELSTTAPVRYHGTSYAKTGDTSRRYLGSILSSSTNNLWAFKHDPVAGRITYTEGSPGVQPFSLWGSTPFSGTSPSLVTSVVANSGASAIAPNPTTTMLHGVASMQGSGTVFVSPADQTAAPAGSNWGNTFGTTGLGIGSLDISPARSGANVGGFYIWVSASSVQNYINAYTFER
jgi:hypothetical protein